MVRLATVLAGCLSSASCVSPIAVELPSDVSEIGIAVAFFDDGTALASQITAGRSVNFVNAERAVVLPLNCPSAFYTSTPVRRVLRYGTDVDINRPGPTGQLISSDEYFDLLTNSVAFERLVVELAPPEGISESEWGEFPELGFGNRFDNGCFAFSWILGSSVHSVSHQPGAMPQSWDCMDGVPLDLRSTNGAPEILCGAGVVTRLTPNEPCVCPVSPRIQDAVFVGESVARIELSGEAPSLALLVMNEETCGTVPVEASFLGAWGDDVNGAVLTDTGHFCEVQDGLLSFGMLNPRVISVGTGGAAFFRESVYLNFSILDGNSEGERYRTDATCGQPAVGDILGLKFAITSRDEPEILNENDVVECPQIGSERRVDSLVPYKEGLLGVKNGRFDRLYNPTWGS